MPEDIYEELATIVFLLTMVCILGRELFRCWSIHAEIARDRTADWDSRYWRQVLVLVTLWVILVFGCIIIEITN